MTTHGFFYLSTDANHPHVRYQRKLESGAVCHDVGLHPRTETPRMDVLAILGEDERACLPENTYENYAHVCGLLEVARAQRDELERVHSGDLDRYLGRAWATTSRSAHGYRP